MANFFSGVWKAATHPIDEAKWWGKSIKNFVKDPSTIKDMPGDHQRMMNKVTVPLLGDNKIAKNSDAIAGAIVGGVLAAPMLAGGAAGSAGGAAGGSAGSAAGAGAGYTGGFGGWGGAAQMGNLGTSAVYTPTTAFGTGASTAAPASTSAASGLNWAQMAQGLGQMQNATADQPAQLQQAAPHRGNINYQPVPMSSPNSLQALMQAYPQYFGGQ